MLQKVTPLLLSLILLSACGGYLSTMPTDRPLEGINITIDPGHGDTEAYDNFRVGPTGEREEWINLRVAKILSTKLRLAGANVLMTRKKDKDVSLGGRATLAKTFNSDLLVSIHHNGSGNDPSMDLPIVYFFGPASQNPASVDFARILIGGMRESLSFAQPDDGAVYSDHLIYSSGTSILRNTIDQMPGVIGEGGFFTHPAGEGRLKSKKYNQLEAEVYFQAILEYFDRGVPYATPLVEDSLEFINLEHEIEFRLNDGFDNSFFEDNSVKIFQDGEPLEAKWNPASGILSTQPLKTDEKTVSFQVFGRNFKGNAIHPIPITFLTKAGFDWMTHDRWREAFDEAEATFLKLTELESDSSALAAELLDKSLQLYQLSLDIQIVHPRARQAEERVLLLLNRKQDIFKVDLSEAIAEQEKRLEEYYP